MPAAQSAFVVHAAAGRTARPAVVVKTWLLSTVFVGSLALAASTGPMTVVTPVPVVEALEDEPADRAVAVEVLVLVLLEREEADLAAVHAVRRADPQASSRHGMIASPVMTGASPDSAS